jgi:hypothetical protein
MKSETLNFPVNLGSTENVTINQLLDIVKQIAGVKLKQGLMQRELLSVFPDCSTGEEK